VPKPFQVYFLDEQRARAYNYFVWIILFLVHYIITMENNSKFIFVVLSYNLSLSWNVNLDSNKTKIVLYGVEDYMFGWSWQILLYSWATNNSTKSIWIGQQ